MEGLKALDRRFASEVEAFLRERRARLQESVRARMTERRVGEPRRSPEEATNAVQSLGEDLEVAILDRYSREAAQIDAALERLAQDEYGICRNCGAPIGLQRLKALPFAQRCTACEADAEAQEGRARAERRPGLSRSEPRSPRP